MRRTTLPLAAAAGLCAVVAACGGGRAAEPAEAIDLPTTDAPEGTGMAAELDGTLAGDVASGCVWLVPAEEHAAGVGERVSVVWPRGFTARANPMRLYRPDGDLVATAGDRLRTGGGFVAETVDEPVAALGDCRMGSHVWLLSTVDRVEPADR